jgi:ribosome-binding protein aMBF1 (putative translation factor)
VPKYPLMPGERKVMDEQTQQRIRALWAEGIQQKELALRFGISASKVHDIVHGRYPHQRKSQREKNRAARQ